MMKNELITYENPKSKISEMFRNIINNLQSTKVDNELKTILITSTLNREGKSWISSNLAVTFAEKGKKVVLIDTDMIKGEQYTIFKVSPRPGLSNYLSDDLENKKENDIDNFIQNTEIDNLSIISSGTPISDSSELLVSHKITKLINELKERFDILIFDGTPSLLVTDAIILSRLVDATILVVEHKKTKIDDIDKVRRTIENVGGNVAGVIVNKIPPSSKKYRNKYYHSDDTSKNNKDHDKNNENIQINEKIEEETEKEETINKTKDAKDTKERKTKSRKIKKSKEINIPDTTIRKTIKMMQPNDIENIDKDEKNDTDTDKDIDKEDKVKKTASKSTKKSKANDRSKDILMQINKYLDKQ